MPKGSDQFKPKPFPENAGQCIREVGEPAKLKSFYMPPPFSIGDTVFTLEDDAVVTFVIGRITMAWQEKFCTYQVGNYTGAHSFETHWEMRDACRCFRTKAELLASL
jgi:hypothetical protein